MRLIDTSVITSGKQYPGLANVSGQSVGNSPLHTPGDPTKFQGLDFLQQALLEMADALSRSLVSSLSVPTWLYESTTPIGGMTYTTGYVYYNGEVFYVPTFNSGPAPFGMKLAASLNYNPTDASPNQLTTLSDGSNVSIHNQRTITVTWSSSSGSFPDVDTWIYTQVAQNTSAITTLNSDITTINSQLASLLTVTPIVVNSGGGAPPFTSGFTGTVKFWKDGAGFVHMWGASTFNIPYGQNDSVAIFVLPAGYRPAIDLYFPCVNLNTGDALSVAVGGASSGVYTAGAVVIQNNVSGSGPSTEISLNLSYPLV